MGPIEGSISPSATKACTLAQTPFARVTSVAWMAKNAGKIPNPTNQ